MWRHRSPSGRLTALAVLATVGALALPGAASALKVADVPDIGADTGRFSLPINCQISIPTGGGTGLKVFDLATNVDVQGVAGTQFGPGQEFFLTQGSGSITFPSWLSIAAGFATVQTVDANVAELMIGATNSTPDEINVNDLQSLRIRGIPMRFGQPLKVALPLRGTFDVGPYTAPDSGVVTLKFNRATAYVDLKSFFGAQLIRIKAVCRPTAGNALLSIAVGGPEGQPPSRLQNQPLNFPAVAPGNLIGIINAPYSCTLGDQQLDVGVAVGATIPLAVRRSGSLLFSKASGALVLPAESVNKLMDSGVTKLSGKVTTLNLKIKGGTPAVQNVATAKGIAIPTTTLKRDTKLTVSLPTTGTLTAGPYKPIPGEESVQVAMSDAAATFYLNGSTTPTLASCEGPSPDVILVDAPVV